MSFGLGLVIGKFLPPHRGHGLVIDEATARSEAVVVILCVRTDDPIPGERRAEWLQELHPAARILVIEDRYDPDDSRVWAENTVRWLGRAPDAVFSSEAYGERYARLMGARHVAVDPERRQRPASGTAVRRDPYACWGAIAPPVRAYFAKRVCVVGAESTGTTTLAAALAERLATPWVEEYGRLYTERKWGRGDFSWRGEELVHVAREQMRLADAAARRANRVLVCDTNAFATVLWHRRYVGGRNTQLEEVARGDRPDLYLLTGDEIPFVQDGLRDGEQIRHEMHHWFEEALGAQEVPWQILRGSLSERLGEALRLTRALFSDSAWSPGADAPGTEG